MDFSFTEEQQLIVDGFADVMNPRSWEKYFYECNETSIYSLEWVKVLCDVGFDRVLLPEKHDGLGLNWVTLAAVYEVLDRFGDPTYILYQLPGLEMIAREGIDEQWERIFSYLDTGEQILDYAMTEPSVGSSWNNMRTTYTRRDGRVHLNGHKTFQTSGMCVPYLVVMARNADDMDVYAEWFVDMSKPGIAKEPLHKLGLRMGSCVEVYFDDAEFEESDLFGSEGNGFMRGVADFDLERFLAALTNYGQAYCAFEDIAKYANQRVQDGQAIARRQPIQLKFTDMQVRPTNMRNVLFEIAWKHDVGKLGCGDCSMAKYYCSYVAFEVVDDALQTLAGVEITGNHRIQRFFRDLHVDRISGGTDEAMILTAGHAAPKNYR